MKHILKQRGTERTLRAIVSVGCSLWLACLPLFLCTTRLVYADGGAPNLAYVAGAEGGVGIIDIAQQSVARRFAETGSPAMLLLSPDGSLLYLAQPAAGSIVAVAAKTGQVICRASFPGHPTLLALSIDAAELYVGGINERTILVLNAQNCVQKWSFPAPEALHWIAATLGSATSNSPRTQLWVAGEDAVSVLDDQGQELARIPIVGTPQFLTLPGSLTAYVATRQGSVIALDMLTYRVIATLLTGGPFGAMDYNAVTGEIYVPDQRLNRVDVLTPVLANMAVLPREPASVLEVSNSPQAIAITNDGQLGFVALSQGQVAMFDIPGHRLLKNIAVGGSPRFIITGAYPPANVPQPISAVPAVPELLWPLILAVAVVLAGGLAGLYMWRAHRQKLPEKATRR